MSKEVKNRKSSHMNTPYYDSELRSPWFLFYPEHFGIDPTDPDCVLKMHTRLEELLEDVKKVDKLSMHAIVHYRDLVSGETEDPLIPSIEKPHAHIAFYWDNSIKHVKTLRFLFDMLSEHSIAYRKEDKKLIESGKAIVSCNFTKAVVYHTHETQEALAHPGKVLYSRDEIVTNLTNEEIEEIFFKYKTGTIKPVKRTDRNARLECYVQAARLAAHTLSTSFKQWLLENVPPVDYSAAKAICSDAWELETQKAIAEQSNKFMRCSIFIYSGLGKGKSNNTIEALNSMGHHALIVDNGGKSGKTDAFIPGFHTAIVFDDSICEDPLEILDLRIRGLYKRMNGNNPNLSKYVVITSNCTPERYFTKYGSYDPEQLNAIISRLFVCTLTDDGHLRLMSTPVRHSNNIEIYHSLYTMFREFEDAYNHSCDEFIAKMPKNPITFSNSIDISNKNIVDTSVVEADPDHLALRRLRNGDYLEFFVNGKKQLQKLEEVPPYIYCQWVIYSRCSTASPDTVEFWYEISGKANMDNWTDTQIYADYVKHISQGDYTSVPRKAYAKQFIEWKKAKEAKAKTLTLADLRFDDFEEDDDIGAV